MSAVRSIPTTLLACEVECHLAAAAAACLQARDFLHSLGLAPEELDVWELILGEAVNNAVNYVRPEALALPVRLELLGTPEWIESRIYDHTAGFDLLAKVGLPPEESESGRGVFLMRSLTDEMAYLQGQNENVMVLRKRRQLPVPLPPPAPAPESASDIAQTLDAMTNELASCYESLAAIFRFSSELQGGVTSEVFIHRWLTQLLVITDSDWFVLRLCDRAPHHLRLASTSVKSPLGMPASLENPEAGRHSVEALAALDHNDVWFEPGSAISREDPLFELVGQGCGFAHPLFVNGTLVGVLTLGRREDRRSFEAGQVSVAQTFGDFLALEIRSTQMQQEQLAAQLKTRDLEITAKIHHALLPDCLPSSPRAALAGFYRSARVIGGDYYDAVPVADGHLLLVMADVMGKGLPAALFAVIFRSLVRARCDLASRPGEFLGWLNKNLFPDLDQAEMFITAQLAFLDSRSGELRVASAGHPPLLVADAQGRIKEIPAGGPPLGVIAGAVFPEDSFPSGGGRILMYTDGLFEARDPQGELLGLEAVKAELAESARTGESCDATRDRLSRLLSEFEHGTAPADDTAFIVVTGREPI